MTKHDLTTRSGLDQWIKDHSLTVLREGPWNSGDYRWIIECPWNPSHTDNAAYIVRFTNGAIGAGCHHNSCQGKRWSDLRDAIEPGWRDRFAASTPPHDSSVTPPEPIPLWGFDKPAPLPWIVSGLLPKGFIALLAADGGTGKSYLAIYLAIMICLGCSFLGLATLRGRVLYVDYELDEDEQKRRVWRVLAGLGLTTKDPRLKDRFYYHRPIPLLSCDAGHDEVLHIVRSCNIDLVILDSLTIGLGADATSQQDVTRILQRFRDWGTVFAIDHISGQAARGNQSRARPFGSVFKRNIARATFTLAQADAGGHLLTSDKNNFGPQQDLLCYALDFSEDNEHVVFRRLDHTDDEMAGAMQHMKTHEITLLAVKSIYRLKGSGVTPEDVVAWRDDHDAAGSVKAGTVRNHFTVLNHSGKIELCGDGTALPAVVLQSLPDSIHDTPPSPFQKQPKQHQNAHSRFTPPIETVNRESSKNSVPVDFDFEDDEAPF